jgi:DNA-binding MarR family transcriptional regulator
MRVQLVAGGAFISYYDINQGNRRAVPKKSLYAPLSRHDYEVLARFRFLLRTFLTFSQVAARKVGLTPQQHQALLAIHGMPDAAGCSVGDLARFLGVRPNSAVGLANRLVKAGLLRREADPQDGRRVTLTLTVRAARLLAALSAIHRDELRRLSADLKPLLDRVSR